MHMTAMQGASLVADRRPSTPGPPLFEEEFKTFLDSEGGQVSVAACKQVWTGHERDAASVPVQLLDGQVLHHQATRDGLKQPRPHRTLSRRL